MFYPSLPLFFLSPKLIQGSEENNKIWNSMQMQNCIHMLTLTRKLTDTDTSTHACTHAHTHAHTHTYIHTHTKCTYMRACTHTHTHTHILTQTHRAKKPTRPQGISSVWSVGTAVCFIGTSPCPTSQNQEKTGQLSTQ